MAALRKINERNQITLPPGILRDAGLEQGSLVAIEAKNGKIILEPKRLADDAFTGAEWAALDKLVAGQDEARRFTEYSSPHEARKHFRKPRK